MALLCRSTKRATFSSAGPLRWESVLARLLIVALAALTVAACSTVEGVGRDIQKGGAVISDTARDVRDAL